MNIATDRPVKIFCKSGEYGNMYSTGISKKQEDGTYLNAYMPVQFKKGTEPNKEANIYIKSAWLTPTKDLKIRIFINEYELVSEVAHRELNVENEFEDMGTTFKSDELILTDDDLPF